MTNSARFAILIPTFDNPGTIAQVVEGCLRETDLPIWVIDDGSAQPVEKLLSSFPPARVRVVRHPRNRGKGAALQTGFAELLAHGYTHAVAIDGDGQHLPGEIPGLTAIASAHPWDLVIGSRRFEGETVPKISRFGRVFSNYWVRYQTEAPIRDSQSGFRVYPLFLVQTMRFFTRRFDFEIEVLIRLLWRGVGVREREVGVYYPPAGERVSHFDKLWDNARISSLNAVLVVIALLRTRRNPRAIATALGLGVFIGCTPFLGFHALIAAAAAFLLHLNFLALLAGTQISIPPMIPALTFASVRVGGGILRVLGGATGVASPIGFFGRWLLGSLGVGAVLGTAAGGTAWAAARRFHPATGRARRAAWTGGTRGGRLGNAFIRLVLRGPGLGAAYAIATLVIPYFYLTAPAARRGLREWHGVLAPERGWLGREWRVIKHLRRFAELMLDRIAQAVAPEHAEFAMSSDGLENLKEAKDGALLVGAHFGAFEIASRRLKRHGLARDFRMVRYEAQGMTIERAHGLQDPQTIRTGGASLLEVREALQGGAFVGMLADRPGGERALLLPFLGKLAAVDPAPFQIARAAGARLIFTFGYKTGPREYGFWARPCTQLDQGVEAAAREYLSYLEPKVRAYPDQWANFYAFFSTPPRAAR